MTTTANAIGYIRVSTDSQADSGAGQAAQRQAIEAFAKANGLTITAWHEDAGVSGAAAIEDRPGLVAALAGLRRGDVLLVAKRDRLARDTFAAMTIERTVAKRRASVMSADGIGNGDGAADAFLRSILDATGPDRSRSVGPLARTAAWSRSRPSKRSSPTSSPAGRPVCLSGPSPQS